jgi:hypothetical protein
VHTAGDDRVLWKVQADDAIIQVVTGHFGKHFFEILLGHNIVSHFDSPLLVIGIENGFIIIVF